MDIETVGFPRILEAAHLGDLDYFVRHTAFVISHKSEPVETLLEVLRYLPTESPLIIVTNCPPRERAHLLRTVSDRLAPRADVYLAHQKDERIAHFFRARGVSHILGADGAVVDGKGEGMYIGALLAALLRTPEWLVYYDADNRAPSALLEYTLAMGRLFMAARAEDAPARRGAPRDIAPPSLHNVRVCWASKPDYDGEVYAPQAPVAGRCTRVLTPLCDELLRARQPGTDQTIATPNAGEQGMTMRTATTLRFSSGFSVETFQLLELLFRGAPRGIRRPAGTTFEGDAPEAAHRVLVQQYLSGSPHFHQKKDDGHIGGMIAESLGSFLHFSRALPPGMARRIDDMADRLGVTLARPAVYPALRGLRLAGHESLAEQFRLEASEATVSA